MAFLAQSRNQIEDRVTTALKIIAEEVQLGEDNLSLDAELNDLGVDSLLSLTISSRLREELDIEMSSTALVDHPTVGALIDSLGLEASSTESRPASTPPSGSDDDKQPSSTSPSSIDSNAHKIDIDTISIMEKANATETVIALENLSGWPLTDLGVDYLLNSTMIDSLSKQVDEEARSDARAIISEASEMSKCQTSKNWNESASTENASIERLTDLDLVATAPHATSVLLQGSPRKAKKVLFLFPDGAGSAASYYALPEISPEISVYGLNCPWLKSPENLKCTLEQYVAKFLVEVRRRQQHGPYNFGGVSAGGILAYEAGRQLARVGEKIDKLVLLDTPDPVGLENPNERMYDFLDSLGMFGMDGKGTPAWLRPHFDAFLRMLDTYDVQKFRTPLSLAATVPTTHIFYARDGMCKDESDPRPEIRPDDPREMRWLINNRTDFSGGGWNTMLGKDNLRITVLDDVNHYTILRPGPRIKDLSQLIARALLV